MEEDNWEYSTEPIGKVCPWGHPWETNELLRKAHALFMFPGKNGAKWHDEVDDWLDEYRKAKPN